MLIFFDQASLVKFIFYFCSENMRIHTFILYYSQAMRRINRRIAKKGAAKIRVFV